MKFRDPRRWFSHFTIYKLHYACDSTEKVFIIGNWAQMELCLLDTQQTSSSSCWAFSEGLDKSFDLQSEPSVQRYNFSLSKVDYIVFFSFAIVKIEFLKLEEVIWGTEREFSTPRSP